jgi:hypothetical protein
MADSTKEQVDASQPSERSQKWTLRRLKRLFGIAASVIAIITGVTKYSEVEKFAKETWAKVGTVELKGSFPGERWQAATQEDIQWLVDEWCYPSLRGFVTRFKLEGGKLYRQNEGGPAQYVKTAWIPIEAYRSNRNVLRLSYPVEQDWPIDFVVFEPHRTAEWQEYTRYINDDGTVAAGEKRLILSCTRCKVDGMGLTYDCKQ